MEIPSKPTEPTTNGAVGRAASKSRKALEALRAAEARRRDAFKHERAELERAAAIEEASLRRVKREHRQKQEGRMASRLGRIVLVALRRQGVTGTLLVAADLNGWPQRDRDELQALLVPTAEPAASTDAASATDGDAAPLDVDLGG